MATILKEFTIDFGEERFVTIEVEFSGHHEKDYGADADGNRGTPMWFIDDVRYVIPNLCDKFIPISKEDMETIANDLEKECNDVELDFNEEYESDRELEDY